VSGNATTNGHAHRVLVVDDEPSIVDAVATALRYEGFEVEEASTGRAALDAVTRQEPDLIVLDWMLPDIDGIEVGRRLRARGFKTAVLFLTAKDATENKVEALRAGGDDYVTKPFSLAEVVARIQAILRRTAGNLPGDVLQFADLVLDENRHEVLRDGTFLPLTATEFSLLRFFMLNPRRVLTRRVELANPQTEVGRLGLSLNAMLAQIESSFRAQKASERKLRRFVADASHELRTPLAAVRAYAELFGRGADRRPDDLERSMAGISRESERMSLLVDDLLLLARLDEGRPLGLELVQLHVVVSEAVETARTVEPERAIETSIEPALVLGDRDRLRQIVDNLLSNVRAHTPPEAAVTVRVSSPNGSAVIDVEDGGPGLGSEDVGRVFERFYRADDSRARASGGVGLGLSIVSAVALAHGGTVAARSEPGRGAGFTITLPLAQPHEGGDEDDRA